MIKKKKNTLCTWKSKCEESPPTNYSEKYKAVGVDSSGFLFSNSEDKNSPCSFSFGFAVLSFSSSCVVRDFYFYMTIENSPSKPLIDINIV